ncbi:hypothetical protein M758_UG288400 [Ceratodon purpureus]|nr:hypothetical protein M758_UG288400 [Ceratodon purpureus]
MVLTRWKWYMQACTDFVKGEEEGNKAASARAKGFEGKAVLGNQHKKYPSEERTVFQEVEGVHSNSNSNSVKASEVMDRI